MRMSIPHWPSVMETRDTRARFQRDQGECRCSPHWPSMRETRDSRARFQRDSGECRCRIDLHHLQLHLTFLIDHNQIQDRCTSKTRCTYPGKRARVARKRARVARKSPVYYKDYRDFHSGRTQLYQQHQPTSVQESVDKPGPVRKVQFFM